MARRVVITGIGAFTPIGHGASGFWAGLRAGRSGISPIQGFDATGFDARIAGEIRDFDPERYMERKEAKRMPRFIQFGMAAAKEALADAAYTVSAANRDRLACVVGSGVGGLAVMEEQHEVLRSKGPGRVSPFTVPTMIANMASGMVAIATGARGPNACPVTACSSGAHAIGDALRLIQRGEADAALAGGTEAAITPLSIAGFCAAKALSTNNDEPATASRPFDATRDGFVMGEGAGVVLLEELEGARARGARIYAELVGYASTGDAYHMTAPSPDGEGIVRAMGLALAEAGLAPEAIGYVNAHGTSTPLNDKIETQALKAAFGEHARALAVSSTKSMTGHLLGAAGGIEAVATALALYHQVLPPTINYRTPDPDCDLDYVPNEARAASLGAALSNSMGFGGHNAVLALRRAEA